MKICSKCQVEKLIDCFIKNNQCIGGYANICKKCSNQYSKNWKRKNSKRLSKLRRDRYAETKGIEVKQREKKRRLEHPLRVRCQLLRSGMRDRSKIKNLKFDSGYFTTFYLMQRIKNNPKCECCGKNLDISFKKDKKFNDSSPSMDRVNPNKGYVKDNVAILCWRCNKLKQDAKSNELRIIANFMDVWGNEVESDIDLLAGTRKEI